MSLSHMGCRSASGSVTVFLDSRSMVLPFCRTGRPEPIRVKGLVTPHWLRPIGCPSGCMEQPSRWPPFYHFLCRWGACRGGRRGMDSTEKEGRTRSQRAFSFVQSNGIDTRLFQFPVGSPSTHPFSESPEERFFGTPSAQLTCGGHPILSKGPVQPASSPPPAGEQSRNNSDAAIIGDCSVGRIPRATRLAT